MATNGELSEIQSRALKMLLEGATAASVAKALGKGKRTIAHGEEISTIGLKFLPPLVQTQD